MTEQDLVEWAEWENSFFDVENTLETRAKARATPKGKRKPMRKNRIPVTVKQVRVCAFQHLKALDHILRSVMGLGLCFFQEGHGR